MQRVEWSERLEIGVGFLDQQHREIMDLLNQLIDEFNAGETSTRARRLMRQLLNHTAAHFSYEETFMLHYGFPGYERHKQIHQEFLVKAEEYMEVVKAEQGQLPEWLLILMRSWYVDHVLKEDDQYREFILSREGATSAT